MSLPPLATIMDTLRARLVSTGASSTDFNFRDPMTDDEVEYIRAQYRPRHVPDELVEFLQLGAVGLFWTAEIEMHNEEGTHSQRLYGREFDTDVVERVRSGQTTINASPLSDNWVLLGYLDNWWYMASTPGPAKRSTVIFWDCGGPAPVEVSFPSLRSLLWTWSEMLANADESEGTEYLMDGLAGGGLENAAGPDEALRYEQLRAQAIALEDPHAGWVTNQPPPRGESDWTMEWLTACGVADIDMVASDNSEN